MVLLHFRLDLQGLDFSVHFLLQRPQWTFARLRDYMKLWLLCFGITACFSRRMAQKVREEEKLFRTISGSRRWFMAGNFLWVEAESGQYGGSQNHSVTKTMRALIKAVREG